MAEFTQSGMIVDIVQRKIFPGTIHVVDGKIRAITEDPHPLEECYILPGFIDAHIHIESSMLIPSEFARLATVHGTVATVSDPHEIGNVLGLEGIRYMIHNGKQVPFHFFFGASPCVPATSFETAGAEITAQDIETLFVVDKLKYLSEVMNYPGVLHGDRKVLEKIASAHALGLPVDGHAPGLRGKDAEDYFAAGISTDHECFTFDEALEKVQLGMHILIREGSAAKNYEALHPLIKLFPEKIMFCSDDKHPHELVDGHIDAIVRRSVVDKGYDLMDVLRAASLNPVRHYALEVGLLQCGDPADFIVINNLKSFSVQKTFVDGQLVAQDGKALIPRCLPAAVPNNFRASFTNVEEFAIPALSETIQVIAAQEGQLITKKLILSPKVEKGMFVADIDRDLLKMAVVNRYSAQHIKPALAFIQNFGFKSGAIASCIAHDSHNIIAVGCNDEEICAAVNLLIEHKGGIALVDGADTLILPLPVAGIMSNDDGYVIAKKYAEIDRRAKQLGTALSAPFMTLSFMALLVIPELKLSDKGLFDCRTFTFVNGPQ